MPEHDQASRRLASCSRWKARLRSPWLALAVVLAGALLLRLHFFSGLIGGDDLAYGRQALDLLAGDYYMAPTPLSNRIGFIALAAASFGVFGVSEFALVLPVLAASLLQIGLAFAFFKQRGRAWTGALAALLLAVLPWDVVYATRGYPDGPSATLFSVFVLALWPSPGGGRGIWRGLVAGLALGAAYMVKEHAAIQLLYWAPCLLYLTIRRRGVGWSALLSAAGAALAVWAAESLWCLTAVGDPLFRLHSVDLGYNQGPWAGAALYAGHLGRRILVEAPLSLFLDIGFLLLMGLGLLLYPLRRRGAAPLGPLYGWLAFDALYLVVGTTSLQHFNPLPLFARYKLLMAFPAALLVADAVDHWRLAPVAADQARVRGWASALLASVLAATAVAVAPFAGTLSWAAPAAALAGAALLRWRQRRAAWGCLAVAALCLTATGLQTVAPALRDTARYERDLHRSLPRSAEPVYADEQTTDVLRFLDGKARFGRFVAFPADQPSADAPAWIVVNEPRLRFLMAEYGYQLPAWVADAPRRFRLVQTLGGAERGDRIFLFRLDQRPLRAP